MLKTKKEFAEIEYTLELSAFQLNEGEASLLKIVESAMTGLANLNPELTIKLIKNLNDTEVANIQKMISTNKKLKEDFITEASKKVPDYFKLEAE